MAAFSCGKKADPKDKAAAEAVKKLLREEKAALGSMKYVHLTKRIKCTYINISYVYLTC